MNIKAAYLLLTGFVMASCSDTTDSIGSSLTSNTDAVNVEAASYDVSSQSILADSVLSRNTTGYLGKVRDTETGNYITGNIMTQFYSIEGYKFPEKEAMTSTNADRQTLKGIINADSCEIRLFYTKHYGDSTRTMKLTAYEMAKPMGEDRNYYSNFDPLKEGYIRNGGISKDKVYTLTDYMVAKSTRDTSTYEPYITLKLNDKYTDANGKVYNNYGTYILEKYYENPAFFKNANTFRNNVVPGFYFKHKSGLGNMAYIDAAQLNVYYKYTDKVAHTSTVNGKTVTEYKDSVLNGITIFWGTEEVLQTTTISNDRNTLLKLAADESCTYLKTPSGIFTELTLPVESIVTGHEHDNIASASLTIPRVNSTVNTDNYSFDIPKTLLMIPKDSINSFFENRQMYNNRNSFIATYSGKSSTNSYTYNNISGMISAMAAVDKAHRSADWNKVVLIPVTLTTSTAATSSSYSSYYSYYYGTSSSSANTVVTKVSHDMSLSSTKLVKGTATNSPLQLKVIYSRFK